MMKKATYSKCVPSVYTNSETAIVAIPCCPQKCVWIPIMKLLCAGTGKLPAKWWREFFV